MRTMKETNNYRKHRLLSGLSQGEAAELLEISESYLEKIELNERLPGRETLIRMSKVYKCKMEDLCQTA